MSKIKLLILLLTSLALFNCSTVSNKQETRFSVGYIGGGEDGLIFSNVLKTYLANFDLYDQYSDYIINATITHDSSFFITNINNTSDRELVSSKLILSVNDKNSTCNYFQYEQEVSQFYVVASSNVYTSNDQALYAIKFNNSESLVKSSIYEINKKGLDQKCQKT